MSWSNGARSNRALVGVGGGWDSAARVGGAAVPGGGIAVSRGAGAGGVAAGRGPQAGSGESFRLGEDVVDPKFGDGVVVGLKSDGIVVHFARDGSERTLLTEFLRLSRR